MKQIPDFQIYQSRPDAKKSVTNYTNSFFLGLPRTRNKNLDEAMQHNLQFHKSIVTVHLVFTTVELGP